MNEKLELLNALQAELEGMGVRICRIGVSTRRSFEGDGHEEVEIHQLTMPCQSGYYHAEWVQVGRESYEVRIVREIPAQIRRIASVLREDILSETVRCIDGPTLKRLFVDAVTRFSAPHMQDFAMVCGNWPTTREPERLSSKA
jgi:hypothetical protein